MLLVFWAPRAGFEPATYRLTAGCSTAELPRNVFFWCFVPIQCGTYILYTIVLVFGKWGRGWDGLRLWVRVVKGVVYSIVDLAGVKYLFYV